MPVCVWSELMTHLDQYVFANDDVMMKNVTSEEESMIQRLSERHIAVIIATVSALTLIMLVIVIVVIIRHRRCERFLSVFFIVCIRDVRE